MKVTMVMVSAQQGGLEKHVRELSAQLLQHGIQVAVVAPPAFLQTLHSGVERHAISEKLSRYNPIALYCLWRKLKLANGDLVHAQANKAAAMVGVLKPVLKTKMIATLHNIKRHVGAYKSFDQVVVVSHQLKHFFTNNKKVHVIYNGIHQPQPNLIDVRQRFNLSAQPVICAVGRLVEAKGFDCLLDAVTGMAVNVLIVGEGPLRSMLEARIKQLPKQTVVKLLGHDTRPTDWMAASDAVVISSRREGFSYVCNEALLTQCRLLATDVPIANEVLPDSLVVPINQPLQLRERLNTLLADLKVWDDLMQPVFNTAKTTLTCEQMTLNTIAVYQQLVAQP